MYIRDWLKTLQQKVGESLQEFFLLLKKLSAECSYAAVSAVWNREAAIRDAFISGITSSYIRQRLLEESELELAGIFDKARSSEDAQRNAESYATPTTDAIIGSVSTCSIDAKNNC